MKITQKKVKTVRSLITIMSWNVSQSQSSKVSVLVSFKPKSNASVSWKYDKALALVSSQTKNNVLVLGKMGRFWLWSCLGLKNQWLGLVPERLVYIPALKTFQNNSDIISLTSMFPGKHLLDSSFPNLGVVKQMFYGWMPFMTSTYLLLNQ